MSTFVIPSSLFLHRFPYRSGPGKTTSEMRKVLIPMRKDVGQLRRALPQLKRSVSELQHFVELREKLKSEQDKPRIASPEEVEKSLLSPRLIQILRKKPGITQKELATLAGVSLRAVQLWEKGKFRPEDDKMAIPSNLFSPSVRILSRKT
jgi:DNA-binding transcriptional regulator YiaG